MVRNCSFLFPLLLLPASAVAQPPHGLKVPPGFEVTEWADSSLANDIFCLTVTPDGAVVVSGRGYIRLLVDEKGTGRATKALEFAGAPRDGAMGLFWEKDALYCMGDGGLRRYRDAGGAGRTKPPELLRRFKTGGEHDAHAIRRGPDGWLYILCGNNTNINRTYATLPTSPIKEPIAGCVLRLAPEGDGCEIVADGFRNPYGMDFNSDGELFTFDSDNERCVSLPWYEPTRLYHVVPGGHYGWLAPQRAQTWRLPPYFLDVVPPSSTQGRGSPTGVVCYHHPQFPERYRDGVFLLDWTFGRVYFLGLQRAGSSYTARSEIFLEAVGENGFAPTAAAVDPRTGDLYLSIGGRGTRGAVYRIRYPQGLKPPSLPGETARPPSQPPRSLAWQPGSQQELLRQARSDDLHARLRALQHIERHRIQFTLPRLEEAVRANWDQTDRLLRQETARILASLPADDRQRLEQQARSPAARLTVGLSQNGAALPDLILDRKLAPALRLDAVRLLQLFLGDVGASKSKGTVWEGYTRRAEQTTLAEPVRTALRSSFPSGDANLDRELSRCLAMIEDNDGKSLQQVADKLTLHSSPIEDIHYLIVLARLRGSRNAELTRRTADALLRLDAKLTDRRLNRDSNWPLRVAELHAELARKDPALNAALLVHADFGRPDHALFAACAGFDRARAAETFLARSEKDSAFAWNAALVQLLGHLPKERALPVLRRLWGQQGQDEAILPLLARSPQPEDRGRFLEGLNSARMATIKTCVEALARLPSRNDRNEVLRLLLALRRLPPGKEGEEVRDLLLAFLEKKKGQKLAGVEAWTEWFARAHPDLAARLADEDGVDVAGWNRRLAGINWDKGDRTRGQMVFVRASCASCHSGSQALGPDLQGVAGRFSRADLFTAILQPSKDVSPRYRTLLLTTTTGKTYQGLIVYEAVDSVILQTGPAATVRLNNAQIAERRLTTRSLMPVGLLDRLTDQDLADLYVYLKGLTGKPG